MRVAVIGAGISGLAAARTLCQNGHSPILFEKSRALGGRCATRRLGPYTFDTGATSISPRGKTLEKVMLEELPSEGLSATFLPIYTHSALRITPGDANRGRSPRYVYRYGINQLAKLLAADLDVRLEHPVETICREGTGFSLGGETFDGVILTPPIPQCTPLLWQLDERRATASISYRSCLSILLGYALPLETSYHALIETEQGHPLTWLSVESVKSPGRAPDGHTALVLQLSSAFSQEHYTATDEWLIATAISFVVRLYGEDWHSPEVKDVKRWKYSQPEGFSSMESVNRNSGRLILAGDGLMGPRVEEAYESGVAAARLMLER